MGHRNRTKYWCLIREGKMEIDDSAFLSPSQGTDPDILVEKCRQWIEETTGSKLEGDFRKALEDGIVLCQFIGKLKPNSVPRYSKLPSQHAHVDNINQFLRACRNLFGLKQEQLFEAVDLEDPRRRHGSAVTLSAEGGNRRRLRTVVGAFYWLGCAVERMPRYSGPQLDLAPFKDSMKSSNQVFVKASESRKKISLLLSPERALAEQQSQPTAAAATLTTSSSAAVTTVPSGSQQRSQNCPKPSKPPPPTKALEPAAGGSTVLTWSPSTSTRMNHAYQQTPPPKPKLPKEEVDPPPPPAATTATGSTDAHHQSGPRTPSPNTVTIVETETLTVPMRSTGTGSFGCQVTGGSDSHIPPTVDMIVPGSPSDLNGLQRGDIIISVNGESTQTLTHVDVVSLMKQAGRHGSIVLSIQRKVEVEKPLATPSPTPPAVTTTEKPATEPPAKPKPPTKPRTSSSSGSGIKVKLASTKSAPASSFASAVTAVTTVTTASKALRRGLGPTHISINQKVVPGPGPGEEDRDGLSEFDAIMASLAEEPIEVNQNLREKKPKISPTPVERRITSDVKGKVQVTISTKGGGGAGGLGHLQEGSPPRDRPLGGGGTSRGSLDADINKLESELHRLENSALQHGDREELSRSSGGSGGGWAGEGEDSRRRKVDEQQNLLSILAQSTQLPPSSSSSVARVDRPPLPSSPGASSSVAATVGVAYSPASMKELADRDSLLKEQMRANRAARGQAFQQLEHQQPSLEAARKARSPAPSPGSWRGGRGGSPSVPQSGLTASGSSEEQDLKLQKLMQEAEEKEQMLAAAERSRQQETQRRLDAEQQLAKLHLMDGERQRLDVAKNKLEQEAYWLRQMEQVQPLTTTGGLAQDWGNRERTGVEDYRRREESRKRDRATEWIRDLEEKVALQVAVRKQRTDTPPIRMTTPPTAAVDSEETRRKADAWKRFDDLMAQEDARESHKSQPPPPRTHSPHDVSRVPSDLPSANQLSKSMGEIQTAGCHPRTQSEGVGKVADVHQYTGPAHRTGSWSRDPPNNSSPSPQPQLKAKVDYRRSLNHPAAAPPPDTCSICSVPLGREPSMSVTETGLKYHARCLKCSVCQANLATGQLSVGILLRGGRPHCRQCLSTNTGDLVTEC